MHDKQSVEGGDMKDTYSEFLRFGPTYGLVVMLCARCGRRVHELEQ